MLPVVEIAFWRVSVYQFMATLALVTAGMWTLHRLLNLGLPSGLVIKGIFLVILSGATAVYLMSYFINAWRIAHSGLWMRPEGISMVWALVGGVGVAAAYCRWRRISIGRTLDMVAPPLALGLAIGRLGCAAAGCCYGRPTDSWLGVYLPDDAGLWATRYPTQMMAAAANLLILFVLLAVDRYGARRGGQRRGWPFDGFLILLFIALYSLKRFGLAFLRQSGAYPMIGPLSWMHVSALLGLAAAGALIFWNFFRQRRK